MTTKVDFAVQFEAAYISHLEAEQRREDWENELSGVYQQDCISLTAFKVGAGLAPHFDWENPNEDGAPLWTPHKRLVEDLPYSLRTLYGGRPDLIGAGLIKVVGNIWHAAVGELHV